MKQKARSTKSTRSATDTSKVVIPVAQGPSEREVDAKGRITLGPAYANRRMRIVPQEDGDLLLEPIVSIHEREAWLFENPEALAQVQEGIRQSKKSKGKNLGSFAEQSETTDQRVLNNRDKECRD